MNYMKTIVATGHSEMDKILKKILSADEEVEVVYLEELKGLVEKDKSLNTVILSSFLPSVFDENSQRRVQSFKETIIALKNYDVRVIFLTDSNFSFKLLEFLFKLGVYDLIINPNADFKVQDVVKCFNHPYTKEKAFNTLAALTDDLNVSESSEIKPETDEEDIPLSNLYDIQDDEESYQPFQPQQITTVRKRVEEIKKEISTGKEKLFAFWGSSQNAGKRTLSQAFAAVIAEFNYKVLYVELDYLNPAFGMTTGLTNSKKNLYQLCLSQETFDINEYIATKDDTDLKRQKGFNKILNRIPDNLHYLCLPTFFDSEEFPVLSQEFLSNFIKALKEVEYDAVVISLSTDLDDVFGFPIMLEVDKIFHVIPDNIVRIQEYKLLKEKLKGTPLDMEKWETLLNQVGEGVEKEALDRLLEEQTLLSIPFCKDRSLYEHDLLIGSPVINEAMKDLAKHYKFMDPSENLSKRKRFFGLL